MSKRSMSRIPEDLIRRILKMYETIQSSVIHLENSELKNKTVFPGFDGNWEIPAIDKAQKMLDNGEYNVPFVKKHLNAHASLTDYYKRCLEKFDTLSKDHGLTEEEILQILES